MQFLDCNLSYGPLVPRTQLRGCANLSELKAHLNRAGIAGGLVAMALDEVNIANDALAADLTREGRPIFWGVWRLLPPHTGEIPLPRDLPAAMKANNIAALTICPATNRFMPNKFAIGAYLEMASERNIPVMLNTARGLTLEQAAGVLADFPDLTCVLTYANCWPSDRLLRPFLDAYPNLSLDMSYMLTDSGLKDILRRYSARRILFGSAFPESYLGAHMLVIKHADISDEDKRLIAGENLLRLIEEARL